jgi:hypothetical protein
MAISYDLEMATPSSTEQFGRELLSAGQAIGLFDTPVTVDELLSNGLTTRLGTWLQVYDPDPEPWEPVITDLGITPTVAAGFRLDKEQDITEQQDDMVRLVSRVLDRIAGDAVLSGLDQIWLLRRGGDLAVSERDDIWPPVRLATLTQPFRRVNATFSNE